MPLPRSRRSAWLLLAAAVGGPALALLLPLPKGSRLVGVFLNFGHVVLGVFVCVLLWQALRVLTRMGIVSRALWAWLGALALLTGMEAFQAFSRTRSPSLGDVVANGLGATTALAFYLVRGRKFAKRLAVAAVPLAIALAPMGLQACDTLRQRAEFPVLADFESQLEMTRWQFRSASGRRAADVTQRGTRSLRVDFRANDAWPAAQFAYVAPDWRGHRWLTFQVHTKAPCTIHLLVVDGLYDGSSKDAYSRVLSLNMGWNPFRVSLDEIARGPEGRTLDLGDVHSIQWFVDGPNAPLTIWLDAIQLEK